MAKIGNVDLGNVERVEPITIKSIRTKVLPGEDGAFGQDLIAYEHAWRIDGHLNNPTQAQREKILNLQNGEVMLFEVSAFSIFGYGKVGNIRMEVDNVFANIYRYSLEMLGCPAVGHTHTHTDDVYLHDMDYRMNLKSFDPHFKHFNVNYSNDRLSTDWQFYLDSDVDDSTQDVLLEMQCGDDIATFYLYSYSAGTWNPVGTWGTGGTLWGGTISFVDAGTGTHTIICNYAPRGTAIANIGTVSYKLGCKYRVLCKIGSLGTHTVADLSTDYSGDQLLLKAKLVHAAAESGVRDYVKMTYIDGSLDYAPA